MTTMTNRMPNKIPNELQPYWKHWNLGRHDYFSHSRLSESARLIPWDHTEDNESFEQLRAIFDPIGADRFVPVGNYVKLEILKEGHWEVVMSDTPDEMSDHRDALLNASGRVLIHGLGLGCVLHCLLHNPKVTHIDVVEVDEDVVNLVAPFYLNIDNGVSLNFHLGSCVDIKWPRGTRWNYVWHDIWTDINTDNLTNDEMAEHGISYATLHRKFSHRADRQGSWAFDLARRQMKREIAADHYVARWVFHWNSFANEEQRYEMLLEATARFMPTESWKEALETVFKDMGDKYKKVARRDMDMSEARMILHDDSMRYAVQKVK